jgi:phenolic acid decarboxylase
MAQNLSCELYALTADLKPILDKHFIHQCIQGEQFDIYIKNKTTIDFRTHTGVVADRWVKGQHANIARLSSSANLFNVSWHEATGTCVSFAINLDEHLIHLSLFFPCWIVNEPQKTIGFENEHIDNIHQEPDAGPTYPIKILDEFSKITFLEDCGEDNEMVIACHPNELPAGYANRIN